MKRMPLFSPSQYEMVHLKSSEKCNDLEILQANYIQVFSIVGRMINRFMCVLRLTNTFTTVDKQ